MSDDQKTSLLEQLEIKATFFIAMGPDNSGKAVWRFLTKRGFLKKMLRSNAVGMYGIRTALSGTLLPARQIARSSPELFQRLIDKVYEAVGEWTKHCKYKAIIEDQRELEQKQKQINTFQKLLNLQNNDGVTPLILAAQLGSPLLLYLISIYYRMIE